MDSKAIRAERREHRRQRLKALMDQDFGGRQVDLAAKIGIAADIVSRYISGKMGIGEDMRNRIEIATGRLGWLDGELGEQPPTGALRYLATREVPVVGNTQGGPPDRIWEELNYAVGYSDEYLELATPDPQAYALRVVGDSMAPRIMAGEWVLVEPSQPVEPGDDVIVKTKGGDVMVKRLVSRRDSEIVLASVNEEFKRITVPAQDIVFVHFVGGIHPARKVKQRVSGQVANRRIVFKEIDDDRRGKPSAAYPKTSLGDGGERKPPVRAKKVFRK